MDIDKWRKLPMLIIRGAPRRVSTWEQLIAAYANTYASHLSRTIPQLLSHMASIFCSGPLGLDLGEYLIHCAGLVAEDALHQTLAAIDGDNTQPPRHRILNPLLRLVVESRFPNLPQLTTGFTLEGRPFGTTVPIVTVLLDNAYIQLTLTPAAPGEARFHYEVTNEKPDWWK
ncbi:MAG: hypothetical protein K2Q25_15650 [Mycobacteriaceae bacterium]|nr:hypothetical protein [Mycobacteriaceae bacterium]